MKATFESLEVPEYPVTSDRLPKAAYSYHKDTGEHVGETTADPDPLVVDNWLIPAQATLISPPSLGENEVAVWSDGKWQVVADFRGIKYAKSDGSSVQWSELGSVPEDLTDIPYPGPFHKWVDSAWQFDAQAEHSDLSRQALISRDGLLAIATLRIDPLQDAVDIDDATSSDVAMLKKWKQYRVALNRIEQQAEFPLNIEWPVAPS